MPTRVSVFHKAQNIDIKNSSVEVNIDAAKEGALDRLLNEVAPNAILNAGGRADEVRCYPGTREEVIGKIEKWMDGTNSRKSRIMWLSGPAGAGKSAIAQTVAERCHERGLHSANFFFFRGDVTRNHAQPLVATLVYQLRRFYPAIDELLTDCMTINPLICKAAIGEQFIRLVSSPIHSVLYSSSTHQPVILIIDGLDECDDKRKQEQVLIALHALLEAENSPFLVLVASRAEPHLVMLFNKLETLVVSIFLDGEYRPQDDIRRFVVAKFNEIKRVHYLAHTLEKHWPSDADVNAITDKSSGQFIYAATVMRFIQYSSFSPALSLLAVHGVRPVTDHSPYAQLDAVYSYIFSTVYDIQTVRFLLGVHFMIERSVKTWLLGGTIQFQALLRHIGYEVIEIESYFADLAPIVKVAAGPPIQLVFYHASLSDYLLNESRSGIYYVDVGGVAAKLSMICLKQMSTPASWDLSVAVLQHVKIATPELSEVLLDASRRKLTHVMDGLPMRALATLMGKIYELYFELDIELYKRLLRYWIRFAYIHRFGIVPPETSISNSRPKNRRVYTYYYWYLITEGLKSALRLHQ